MPSKKSIEPSNNEDFPSLSGSSSNSNTIGKWGTKKDWGATGKVVHVGVKEASSTDVLTPTETTRIGKTDDVSDASIGSETLGIHETTPDIQSELTSSPVASSFNQSTEPLPTSPDANVSPYVGLRLISSSSKNDSPSTTSTQWNFSATPFVPSVSSSSSSSLPVSSPDSAMVVQNSEKAIGECATEEIQQPTSSEVPQESPPPPPLSPQLTSSANLLKDVPSESVSKDEPSSSLDPQPAIVSDNIFGNDDFPSLGGTTVVRREPVVWSAESSRNAQAPPPSVSLFEATDWTAIDIGEPIVERDKIPMRRLLKTPQNTIKVIANSYVVDIKPMEVFKYDVLIFKCYMPKNKTKEARSKINGGQGSDQKRQTQCVRILDVVLQKFFQISDFIFDGASLMYVPKAMDEEAIRKSVRIESSDKSWPADIKEQWFAGTKGRFEIEFKLKGSFSTGEIWKEVVTNTGSDSNKVRTMLQIAFTSEARRGGFLVSDKSEIYPPQDKGPQQSANPKESVKLVRSGISLGVAIAEGVDRKGRVQLTIAQQLTNFLPEGPLTNLQKLLGVKYTNVDECRKALKHLKVRPCYNEGSTFEIRGFSDVPVKQLAQISITDPETQKKELKTVFEHGKWLAKKCKIRDYNSNNYAVKVEHVKIVDGKVRKDLEKDKYYHLVENLELCPDQKLPASLAEAPRAPPISERVRETIKVSEAAKILSPNHTLAGFNVRVDPKPIEVSGVRIEPPLIQYSLSGISTHIDVAKGAWKIGRTLVLPTTIKSVLILYRPDSGKRIEMQIQEFKELLSSQSALLANKIPLNSIKIEDLSRHRGSPDDVLEQRIKQLTENNEKPYVFYADGVKNSHGYVKLIERQNGILIEHLNVAQSLQRMKESTSKSIILKMNLRNRGINHSPVVNDPSLKELWGKNSNTLIISYDVCFCAGAKNLVKGEQTTEPSTIGFGFNGTEDPGVFIGDLHYQNPRQEIVNGPILQSKTIWMLDKYTRARKKIPKNIVIVRDGLSNAQYDKAINELKEIKTGIEKYMEVVRKNKNKKNQDGNAIKITMLIITKRQSIRFFCVDSKGVIQNIPPLTAINDVIIRKEEPENVSNNNPTEILFVPHKPVDGTAAPHMINVFKNQVFESFDQLMKFMAALCCANQVSTCIGSLPDCLVAADAYAKRGAELFEAYSKQLKKQVKQLPTKPYSEGIMDTDWDQVSDDLCYEKCKELQNSRLA